MRVTFLSYCTITSVGPYVQAVHVGIDLANDIAESNVRHFVPGQGFDWGGEFQPRVPVQAKLYVMIRPESVTSRRDVTPERNVAAKMFIVDQFGKKHWTPPVVFRYVSPDEQKLL